MEIPELLVEEKKQIQDVILESVESNSLTGSTFWDQQSLNGTGIKPQEKKMIKRTKIDLITDIIELQKASGVHEDTPCKLKKLTKPELLRILAGLMNEEYINPIKLKLDKGEIIIDPEKATNYENTEGILDKPTECTKNTADKKIHNIEMLSGTEALWNFNLILLTAIESICGHSLILEKTGGVLLFDGAYDRVKDKREILLPLYKALYIKYGGALTMYLNPLVQILIIESGILSTVAFDNLKKKKKTLSED